MDFSSTFLKRFREGDTLALREVYDAHVEEIHRLARCGFSIAGPPPRQVPPLRDVASQKDFVQEVFVRAFGERARAAYDGLRPYRPYLLQIARNLRIDQVRRSGKELLSLDDPRGPDIDALIESRDVTWTEPLEDDLHLRQLEAAAEEFVNTQDDETREFVRLRFVEELSQAEAAERAGVTRRRVRTLEARVQHDLRAYLRRLGLWSGGTAGADSPARVASAAVDSKGDLRERR